MALPYGEPGQGVGSGPRCGRLKYGLTGKPSTRRQVSQITILRGFRHALPGLGEEDGWLLHSPPGRVQGLQVAQPDPRQGRGGGGSKRGPHRFGGRWNERLRQHRDPGDGAGQVREHGVELGRLLRLLREFVGRRLLDVAVRGARERDELGGALLQAVRIHGASVGDRKSTRLNSSHSQISYAVFCFKKKKKNI